MSARSISALVICGCVVVAQGLASPVRAATKTIDLDGDGVRESSLVTRVLQSFPIRIQNVVFNEAAGEDYTFEWASAGPGGFDSSLAVGPGVGVKWRWTTHQQVFSFTGSVCADDICFEQLSNGADRGPFGAPGKSIFPAAVTLSSATLTSSLITFFSDPREIAGFGSHSDGLTVTTTVRNPSAHTLTLTIEDTGCCAEPNMTICEDGCKFYLSDEDNCGGCGTECSEQEVCSEGECVSSCPEGETSCEGICTDLSSDPENCGECFYACEELEDCYEGQCIAICDGCDASVGAAAGTDGEIPVPDPIEAPVCGEPIVRTLAPGEIATECETGSGLYKETVSNAVVQQNGTVIAEGPFVRLEPDTEAVIGPVTLAVASVRVVSDDSSDGLCGPGESCDLEIGVQNVGPSGFANPVATLSSPPDALNPLPVVVSSASSAYPDFPGYTASGDCDNPGDPPPILTNLMRFTVSLPEGQDEDVGRRFVLDFTGDVGTDAPGAVPFVIGLGGSCDPAEELHGETYDGLQGLLSPVNAPLVPEGHGVSVPSKSFRRGSTLPLKVRLTCGSQIIPETAIDPPPELVAIESFDGGTAPPLSAVTSDPFFVCDPNLCKLELKTTPFARGRYVVGIEMPDGKIYRAGFELR